MVCQMVPIGTIFKVTDQLCYVFVVGQDRVGWQRVDTAEDFIDVADLDDIMDLCCEYEDGECDGHNSETDDEENHTSEDDENEEEELDQPTGPTRRHRVIIDDSEVAEGEQDLSDELRAEVRKLAKNYGKK